MPITALQGYDGRAFEIANLNTAGTILTLTRGNGTTKDIVLPTGSGGGAPTVQTGYTPHYMSFNGGGIGLNYAGIQSCSFWFRANTAYPAGEYLFEGRVANGNGGYWYYGGYDGLTPYINGVVAPFNDNFNSLRGNVWRLVYLDYSAGPGGFNIAYTNSQGYGQFFDTAQIADLRVYDRKWTATEIANTDATKVPTDMIARYDFTNTTSTQIIDQSGSSVPKNALFVGTPGSLI